MRACVHSKSYHLGYTKAMPEVVERIVSIVGLDSLLNTQGMAYQSVNTVLCSNERRQLTKNRRSTIGLMFNSVTIPSSWYMYSNRDTIYNTMYAFVSCAFKGCQRTEN